MGDHMAVFRSLRELFPQVDTRILKAVAIEHHKDVDSAVVAVLDDVMPSMTGSVGASGALHEALASIADSVGTSSASHVTRETGSSSSAGHDMGIDEVGGSVDSAKCTSSTEVITDMQENVVGEPDVGRSPSYRGTSEQLSFPSHPVPELNDNQCVLTSKLIDRYLNPCSERNWAHSENEVVHGGYIPGEYFAESLIGENGNDSINLNVAQVQERDSNNTIPVWDCIAQDNNSLKFLCDYAEVNDVNDPFWAKIFAGVSNNEVSTGILSIEKDVFAPVLNFPIPDISESSAGPGGVLEQKDTNSDTIDCNKQQSGNIIENGDTFLSSKTDLLPDLNLNHFASTASTHSNHSVNIEPLEDSIADAKNNKNDLLPSLELVTKMIEDVELLEEKAKVAKCESSVAGTGILTKVEELKEMLNHAKEANDMVCPIFPLTQYFIKEETSELSSLKESDQLCYIQHAGEVFGEKSILTTEARELQSRLQRLSDERNSYLVVIEEIRQTLEERLVAAQQEIEAAEKEKIEKEASAQALLNEQEKEMNSIVEESRKLQKEAEENLKLKDFLVERGRIVDILQGEMAVICEDVSQLKRIVVERLSWSKLQRSTISSLSSSLHSSLHKSGSFSDRTIEAVESTDKHTVAEGASPVVEDLDGTERMVEVLDGSDITDKDNSKGRDSNADGWEFC